MNRGCFRSGEENAVITIEKQGTQPPIKARVNKSTKTREQQKCLYPRHVPDTCSARRTDSESSVLWKDRFSLHELTCLV